MHVLARAEARPGPTAAATRRRIGTTTLTILLMALASFGSGQVLAAPNNTTSGPGEGVQPTGTPLSWGPTSMDSVGCENTEIGFTTVLSGYTGGPERFRTIVDAGGLRYMDEDAGQPSGGDGTYTWSLYNSSTGGPTTATFPIPPNIPVTVNFLLIDGVGGPTVTQQTVVISQCNGGVILGGEAVPLPTLGTFALGLLILLTGFAAARGMRPRRKSIAA